MASRTLLFIYVLDSGFAVANNQPLRIVIRELEMDLVCPELCFQAENEKDCLQHIRTWTSNPHWKKDVSVFTAINAFQHKDMNDSTRIFYSQTGILNLYAIAASIHSITFHMRLAFGGSFDAAPLENMIANWKTVWMSRNDSSAGYTSSDISTNSRPMNHAPNDWRRAGFMKHAPEVWLLSKRLLELIQSYERHQKQAAPLDFVALSRHALLDGTNVSLPAQEKYDDTSMSQFNNLLNAFESMSV
jgi:hypothetical protein